MLRLQSTTDEAWGERALSALDEILLDHAHLEKKAASMAVTLLFQYPERTELQRPLSELAREELRHFEAMLGVLEERGIPFGRHRPGPYAGLLRAEVRREEPGRLVDLLLCSALIEARSCERLGLLGGALARRPEEAALASLYRGLHEAEARHHGIYVALACGVQPEDRVRTRLEELAKREAWALAEAAGSPRVHGDVKTDAVPA
ncbi:MAG: tRNA-(ms[2]io[6]A)-hydroxylase [Myxococcota bacterium]|nr:tRNA-(ms[2]io[6]A)-hydroxylase [Myxococcota bacterium]